MPKTLLIVFIHGFKGGDDTFGNFPKHIQVLLSRSLPSIKVVTTVYPRYETRGNLKECVMIFREWLQNQVIDLEVLNRTPCPTVDPSVHVFLVGHSMGGIVAAETLLLLASEQPIPARMAPSPKPTRTPADPDFTQASAAEKSGGSYSSPLVEPDLFMFPHVQGLFAFDTPFLGVAPGVVSHGAEGHYRNITSTYNAFSEVAGLFGFGANDNTKSSGKDAPQPDVKKALPPPAGSENHHGGGATLDGDAAATPSWQRWGRYAMFAGAAGAVAAGGAAAMYSQRHRLTDGWSWVSSHLAFVGCLARPTDLRLRLNLLSGVKQDRGISCVNFYTCLGKNAASFVDNEGDENSHGGRTPFSQKIIRSKHRTFCSLPAEQEEARGSLDVLERGLEWVKAVNDNATDEIKAHTCMFLPKENPAFYELVNNACTVMIRSVDKGWYTTATGPNDEADTDLPRTEKGRNQFKSESGSLDGEDVVLVD